MKIKNTLYNNVQDVKIKNDEKDAAKKQSPEKVSSGKDTISLSSKAVELSKTIQVARDSDDIRVSKVSELKEKVESGEYTPDSKKIAEKLVNEELDLWL